MTVDYKTDLRFIEGFMTGLKYRDDIFHQIVRPIACAVEEDFFFMDNNVRPHRAGIVNEHLESEAIQRMVYIYILAAG